MKLTLTVRRGSEAREHHLELNLPREAAANQGTAAYTLGAEKGEMDWAEVAPGVYSILIGGRSYEAQVVAPSPTRAPGDASHLVTIGTLDFQVTVHDPRRRRSVTTLAAADGPQEVVAPMPGKIVKILVARHEGVAAGSGLLVIEAMKMQNELRAPRAGRVEEIYVEEGKGVETGARLLRLG
jgi:biotin carboxyl carrier protein